MKRLCSSGTKACVATRLNARIASLYVTQIKDMMKEMECIKPDLWTAFNEFLEHLSTEEVFHFYTHCHNIGFANVASELNEILDYFAEEVNW